MLHDRPRLQLPNESRSWDWPGFRSSMSWLMTGLAAGVCLTWLPVWAKAAIIAGAALLTMQVRRDRRRI